MLVHGILSQAQYAAEAPAIEPVTRELYAWYDAQDSTQSGATISDLSGNSRTATAINSPTKSSAGWLFNGGNQRIDTSFLDSALDGTNRTIEVWVKYNTGVSMPGGTALIFNGTGGAIFGITTTPSGDYRGNGYVMRDTSNNLANGDYLWNPIDDAYHQYVIRRAGSTLSIWVDGVSRATATNANVTSNISKNVAWNLMGGHENRYISGNGAYMGIARFYNTNLSDAEILQNYDASNGKFS